jgi:hypothetical protein
MNIARVAVAVAALGLITIVFLSIIRAAQSRKKVHQHLAMTVRFTNSNLLSLN